MYRIMVFRVVVLLVLLLLTAFAKRGPAWLYWCLWDQDLGTKLMGHDIRRPQSRKKSDFEIEPNLIYIWRALGLSVGALSLLWLCIASHMLLVGHVRGRTSPLRGEISADMARVMRLTALVDETRDLGDAECRDALLRLKQRDCPRFMLMNIASTFGPIVGFVSRFAAEIYSVIIFGVSAVYYASTQRPVPALEQGILGFLLACTVFITVDCLERQHPMQIFVQAKRSWDRGVPTEPYLDIIRADKGAQALPALFIKIIGLPFAARNRLDIVVSWGGILGVVAVVGLFAFQRFDLGIENEGLAAVQDGRLWTGQANSHGVDAPPATTRVRQVVELPTNFAAPTHAEAAAEGSAGST